MKGILLAGVLLLASCTGRPGVAQLQCPPVDGVEQVLSAPGVFIGDIHGTKEPPAFLAALACHAMKSGRPVVVAMEYSSADQPVLDQFLRVTIDTEAERLLTSTTHWTGNRDGRASGAMRDALLAIRAHSRAGGNVKLVAYDLPISTWQERDRASAAHIGKIRAAEKPPGFWIVFGGNVHARKTKGLPFANAPQGSGDHEPLGYLIRDWGLLHLDADYRGGAGWACMGPSPGDCSVREIGPGCRPGCPLHPVIRLRERGPAYDGVYDVGELTVSRPLNLR